MWLPTVCDIQISEISYLSKSRSRGCLIFEKQLANIQNWENWTGETKQSVLLYNHSKAWKTTPKFGNLSLGKNRTHYWPKICLRKFPGYPAHLYRVTRDLPVGSMAWVTFIDGWCDICSLIRAFTCHQYHIVRNHLMCGSNKNHSILNCAIERHSASGMDGWMACNFTFFSTVFQSNQDNGRMTMKGCVQWDPVYCWKDFCLERGLNPDCLISKPILNLLNYWSSQNGIELEQMPRQELLFVLGLHCEIHTLMGRGSNS